ncbi:MAG: glycosyltransferase family 9 protein [Opitutaceae bacterium]|nr:glycosyltransferase family 9 protein [Opitutaceae bacterium]
MKRILVLRGGAMGDFIVTLPALDLLRRRWPEAQIELIGNPQVAVLGGWTGHLHALHSQHAARWVPLFGPPPLPSDLGTWLDGFDLVLNYWPDPDRALARHFPRHSRQSYLAASAQPVLTPAARHFCAPLRELGLTATSFHSRLPCLSGHLRDETIAIHPGSGSSRKNWPLERWIELCERLSQWSHVPLLIVGGEADAAGLAALSRFGEVSRQLPLPALAERLARCRLFLGHDSGVSHLAAASHTPCLLLFGPTDPVMWAPPGEHVRVLREGTDLKTIPVEKVWATLIRLASEASAGLPPSTSSA